MMIGVLSAQIGEVPPESSEAARISAAFPVTYCVIRRGCYCLSSSLKPTALIWRRHERANPHTFYKCFTSHICWWFLMPGSWGSKIKGSAYPIPSSLTSLHASEFTIFLQKYFSSESSAGVHLRPPRRLGRVD